MSSKEYYEKMCTDRLNNLYPDVLKVALIKDMHNKMDITTFHDDIINRVTDNVRLNAQTLMSTPECQPIEQRINPTNDVNCNTSIRQVIALEGIIKMLETALPSKKVHGYEKQEIGSLWEKVNALYPKIVQQCPKPMLQSALSSGITESKQRYNAEARKYPNEISKSDIAIQFRWMDQTASEYRKKYL